MLKNVPLARKALSALLLLAISYAQAQPKINFITPISAPVGTSVTIAGNGFNPSTGGNTVLFGSVKAPVISASATSLTVSVPAGTAYQTISVVNNANNLTGYFYNQFITSYAGSAGATITSASFQPKVDFSFPFVTHPGAFTFSDLDGDGKIDLSYLDIPSFQRDPSALYIARNVSIPGTINQNTFSSGVSLPVGQLTSGLVANDINGDAKQDLLVRLALPARTQILQNVSTPGTLNSSSYTTPLTLSNMSVTNVGDVDGDGIPDVLFLTGDGTISVQRGLSTAGSSFGPAIKFVAGNTPAEISLTDLDGDSKPEIVIRNNRDNLDTAQIAVLRNTSTPGTLDANSFAPKVDFNLLGSTFYTSMIIGDVDGDGKPDLSVGLPGPNTGTGRIAVLRNMSTPGSFTTASLAAPVDFPAGISPRNVHLGDINGDGRLDLIYVNANSTTGNAISFQLNLASPGSITPASFSAPVSIAAQGAGAAFLQDIDADGKPEIVTVTESGSAFSIIKLQNQSIVPVITSISPALAVAGTNLTITGANFNSSSNIVYFGAVRAPATTLSSSSIQVAVPRGAGYLPVSVLNPATGLTAYSPQPFLPTFHNLLGQDFASGFYQPKIDFATGASASTYPYSFAVGDIDGDGKADIAVVYANSNNVTVLHNTSSTGVLAATSFTEKTSFATGANPLSVLLKDMDGDGKLDLVVANNGPGTVSVLYNTASPFSGINAGSFAAKVDFPVSAGAHPYAVAAGDVNSDGKPDIIVANSGGNTISVLPNTSSPGSITSSSFGAKVDFATGNFPRALAVGDVDGDGKPDVVVTNETDKSISVLRNATATGGITGSSFAPRVDFATGNTSPSIVLTDVDGDGKADLVAANYNSNTVSVLRNLSSAGSITAASFATKVDFATGQQPFSVTAGDANGDGRPDLAVANAGSNTVSILRNTAASGSITATSFAAKADFAVGPYPIAAAMADLDNDGAFDIATANANSNTLSILKIDYALLRPTITSITPSTGPAGSSVTITGTNFNEQNYNNTVFFGAVAAPDITSSSATSLTVNVPTGATYKEISVLNIPYGLTGYSAKQFIPTFTNPFNNGIPANFYLPKVDFTTASLPYYETIGDVDRDGKTDIVVVNANVNTVSLLHNVSSTGTISASSFERVDFAAGNDPRSVALADIDGDGKLDIILVNAGSGTLSVLRNTAYAGNDIHNFFDPKVDFTTGTNPFSVAIGDVNADGKADLVVANTKLNTVSVLINTTNTGNTPLTASSFAPKVDFPAGTFPRFVVVRDVDGDGRADLVVVNEQSNTVSVLRNQVPSTTFSSSAFAAPVGFAVGAMPNCVAVGDLDGDGKPELAVSNYGTNNISVLHNTATPGSMTASSFAAKVDLATNPQPFFVAMGDADGDGKADLLSANASSNTISILRNIASGSITASSFETRKDFATGGYPTCVAVGDLDGDGIAEVISSNAGNNTVSVLKVNAPAPATVASGALYREGAVTADGQSMQVYPNPAKGAFTLQLAGIKGGITSLEIFNEAGKTVEKRTVNLEGKAATLTMQLSLQHQPAGVYYVKATSTGGVQIVKVMIQR
ncbi:MAG: VCBS repeat-containing protein [Williamsia sp.]|nr:VCBS repeat-containing protein [Williamsia sp.]